MAKPRLGAPPDSDATSGEGVQNLLCAYPAGVLAVAVRALSRIAAGDANGLRHPLSAFGGMGGINIQRPLGRDELRT